MFDRAERGELAFGTVDSWLVWKLTSGEKHITDVTNASRRMKPSEYQRCADNGVAAVTEFMIGYDGIVVAQARENPAIDLTTEAENVRPKHKVRCEQPKLYPGGGGTNVVNVILVDFRGFDTFGEIIVLGIAALVIFAAADVLLRGPTRARLLNFQPDRPRAGDRHPVMMVINTRVMMPIVLLVGIYIFLRGHNAPGGGFVAGLVTAMAMIVQYMANGATWTRHRFILPYRPLIGAGLVAAAGTGINLGTEDKALIGVLAIALILILTRN